MTSDIEVRIALARAHGPKDIFTVGALAINHFFEILAVVLIPVQIVTTLASGCLLGVFRILIVPLNAIWMCFSGLLLGTSWLWLNAPYLRPFLLVIGLIVAITAHLFVQLISNPDGPSDRYVKMALSGLWPLSWYLLKPPPEYYISADGY